VTLERSKLALPSEKDWVQEDRATFSGTATARDGGVLDGTLAPTDCGHCSIPAAGQFAIDCISCAHARLTCIESHEFVLAHEKAPASCRNKDTFAGRLMPATILECASYWPETKVGDDWKLTPEGLDSVFESWDLASCGHLPRRMK
jgi:hypothetical protein